MKRYLILLLVLLWTAGCQAPPPEPMMQADGDSQAELDKEFGVAPGVQAPPVPAPIKEGHASPIPSGSQPPPEHGYFGYERPPTEILKAEQEAAGIRPLTEEAPRLFQKRTQDKQGEAEDEDGAFNENDEPVILSRLVDATWPGYTIGSQKIGDCVSWGYARGCNILRAKIHLQSKEPRGPPPLFACTEAIYGGSRCEVRGRTFAGFGDGSYGGAASKFVRDWGVVYRKDYPATKDAAGKEFPGYNLTEYSGTLAKDWGAYGCGGKNDGPGGTGRFDLIAKEHPVKRIALVRSFAEAAVAIKNGYPVPVCSGQGFTSKRDKDGFCSASGSWAHCMNFEGVRFDRPGLLCMNSWGPSWVSGPLWPDQDRGPRGPPQPAGSFWVDAKTVDRMLAGEDSYALSELGGFDQNRLKLDEGW